MQGDEGVDGHMQNGIDEDRQGKKSAHSVGVGQVVGEQTCGHGQLTDELLKMQGNTLLQPGGGGQSITLHAGKNCACTTTELENAAKSKNIKNIIFIGFKLVSRGVADICLVDNEVSVWSEDV